MHGRNSTENGKKHPMYRPTGYPMYNTTEPGPRNKTNNPYGPYYKPNENKRKPQVGPTQMPYPAIPRPQPRYDNGFGMIPGPFRWITHCFPADATVHLESGDIKRMDQLCVGDRVKTGFNTFSTVFSFTHMDSESITTFVQVETNTGHKLEMTAGHYIIANGELVAAADLKHGDTIQINTGETAYITGVTTVQKQGLYNPQTLDGMISVNGVVATTFTTAVEPPVARALLTVVATAYRYFGLDIIGQRLAQGAFIPVSVLRLLGNQ